MENESRTLGERRILWAGSTGNKAADFIQQKTVEVIDFLESLRNDEASRTYDTVAPDREDVAKRITLEASGDVFRLISMAQTAFEQGCDTAVKAALRMRNQEEYKVS